MTGALAALLLCLAPAARGQADDLSRWLAGLAGPDSPIPARELAERLRRPELPAQLRALARGRGAAPARLGALRVLGLVEGEPGDETEGLLVEAGGADPAEAVREAAWRALAARGSQVALGASLGRALLGAEPWPSVALRRVDLLQDGPGALELARIGLAREVPLPLRLRLVRRLGEVGATQTVNRIRELRLDREALPWDQGRQLDCVTTVALLRLGQEEQALPFLLELALDQELVLAADALEGLRALPAAQRVEAFRGALGAADVGRRQRALQVLVLLPPEPELVLLVEAMAEGDGPPSLRQAAVQALGRLGTSGSVEKLVALLARRGEESAPSPLRREAADALARLPASDAGRRALEGALEDEEAVVRRAALRGLIAYGDPRSAPALRELLRRRPASTTAERLLCLRAAERLRLVEGEAAARLLALRGEDEDPELARALVAYARVVPDLGPVVPALLELLEAPRAPSPVRASAWAALVERTGQRIEYDPERPPYEQAQSLARWRAWWKTAAPR